MAIVLVQLDFLDNGRGGFFLLHVGYKYNNKVYWRCDDRQCPATLTTCNNIVAAFGRPHNHEEDYIGLAAESLISGVKKRCKEEAKPIPAICDEEIGGLRNSECNDSVEDMIRNIPTFQACKSSLYRNQSTTIPKLPTTKEDINLEGPWTVFIDGTFYSCTKHFNQLYTLHASVNGTMFPIVFVLLPNKSEATYNRFFGLLKDVIQDLQSVLNLEPWLLDIEMAARNAVQRNFPGISLKGCFFHFTQCIWKKV